MKNVLRKIELEYQIEEGELDRFNRKCDECGEFMTEGYVIDGGSEYYCSSDCLHKHYTPEDWQEMYGDGDTDNYWTEWEVEKPEPCGDCIYYGGDCERDPSTCPYAIDSVQSQGICPECGSDALEYDSADFEANVIIYPWECNNCKAVGDECYDMKFIEHENIIKGDE